MADKISAWQDQVDVLLVLTSNTVHDQHGELMPSEAVVNWITANSAIPETASWAYQVKDGILASGPTTAACREILRSAGPEHY